MRLLEVVVALNTAPEAVERAAAFARQIGKTAIRTKGSLPVVFTFSVPFLTAGGADVRGTRGVPRVLGDRAGAAAVLGDQAVLEAAGYVPDGVYLHAQLAPAAGTEPRRIEGPAAALADLGRPPASVAVHGLDRLRERPDRHT
jgi:hypothetical protein